MDVPGPDAFAQLRLLFSFTVRKVDGGVEDRQLALVRWFERVSQPDILSSYGCTRLRWERQGSDRESYQVIPLASIIRREYVVPDLAKKNEEWFHVSPFKMDRGVPDKREYVLSREEEEDGVDEFLQAVVGLQVRCESESDSEDSDFF